MGSLPSPGAVHSALKICAGNRRSSAWITSNLPLLNWRNDAISRRQTKQSVTPPTPKPIGAPDSKLPDWPSRKRRPTAARTKEFTERKKVFTPCLRAPSVSDVSTKILYCASNVAASESVGSPVGNSPASSCSDSWVIQLAYYGVEVPRHRRDADLGKCGWNGRCVGLQIDCENTFAQLDALANFPIDGLAPPSSVPDKTDCCGRCSNQALRMRLPCVLNRFLDGVVAKLQRGMAIVRLATERVDKSLVLRGETEENIGRHESATSSIGSLEGYLNYNAVIR